MTVASGGNDPPQGINRRRLVLRLACLPVFIALFMFLPAGTWVWPKGWLFILVLVVVVSAIFLALHRINPEVIVARSSFHEGTKGWDKILLSFYFPAMAAVLLVAALDDGRFHWFRLPWWVCGVGYALLLAGIGIVTHRFSRYRRRHRWQVRTVGSHHVFDWGRYPSLEMSPESCHGRPFAVSKRSAECLSVDHIKENSRVQSIHRGRRGRCNGRSVGRAGQERGPHGT